jgi:HD-GYP domain-containing protein (c-di-GMP phosphodiesterase class II)
MMGITDIFDALTAQDRPYKPALPLAKALNILRMDANNNALNKDLVDLFEKKEVYKCLDEKPIGLEN